MNEVPHGLVGGFRLGNRIRETLRVIPDRNGIQTSTGRATVVQRNWANDEQRFTTAKNTSASLHTLSVAGPVSSLHVDAGRGRLYLSDKAMKFYTSLCFRCYIYIYDFQYKTPGWQDSCYASAPGHFSENKHWGHKKVLVLKYTN